MIRLAVVLALLLSVTPSALGATRPVGAKPLRDRVAAQRVVRSAWEPRPSNRDENRRIPTRRELRRFRARSDMPYKRRVTGHFRGTTDEILQWVALKHGIATGVVRAVAVQESWWRISTIGDNGDSFGIMQMRRPYHCCLPLMKRSTAFNADYWGAIIRAYYDGKMPWLNDVERGRDYAPGDLWGSVGAWFAGRWWTEGAARYVEEVRRHVRERTWRTADFRSGDG